MAATRWSNGNTSQNAQALIEAINDTRNVRVTLFATSSVPNAMFTESDGPETNLPLLAALAQSTDGNLKVFDGLFLTAARQPRYLEVRAVLDAAVRRGSVYFSEASAPFTSALAPEEAAKRLNGIAPVRQLTSASRANFFRLLSGVTEAEFAS
ncbi:hypothetical protein [Ralstonia pseudosolanacearum]|uniref:hypothetical protein n=1 Tax=Ralstonia pseudosolanacearum TaxID=1310165 RepID=UPI0033919243